MLGNARSEVKHPPFKGSMGEVSNEFISLYPLRRRRLFKEHSTILHSHLEQQMFTDDPKRIEYSIYVAKVGKDELELLNKFYFEYHVDAWAPIEFEAGPY